MLCDPSSIYDWKYCAVCVKNTLFWRLRALPAPPPLSFPLHVYQGWRKPNTLQTWLCVLAVCTWLCLWAFVCVFASQKAQIWPVEPREPSRGKWNKDRRQIIQSVTTSSSSRLCMSLWNLCQLLHVYLNVNAPFSMTEATFTYTHQLD